MSLKDELNNALKDAMRARDAVRKMVLRDALSAIKLAEVDKGELDDADMLAIVQKEVKSRRETITDAEKAGRDDLIQDAKNEIEVLEGFLPQALSNDELKALVDEAIAESGAASMGDMGKVMGVLMPKIQGRADGGAASALVRERLGS